MIFVPKYVFRVVFEGGIFGGVRNFWGNPYLNSTIVLFDKHHYNFGFTTIAIIGLALFKVGLQDQMYNYPIVTHPHYLKG